MSDRNFDISRIIARPIGEILAHLADIQQWHGWTGVYTAPSSAIREELGVGDMVSLQLVLMRAKGRKQPVPVTYTIGTLPDPAADSPTLVLLQSAPMGTLKLSWQFKLTPLSEDRTQLEIHLDAAGWLAGLIWPGFRKPYQDSMEQFAADLRRKVDSPAG